jgi:molecular chaperone DnaJ
MATKRDYYEVLGVSKAATADELKKAYRKLAMQHHPDKHGGDDSQFKEIAEAYETLSDPQKKAGYDQFGHAGAGGNPFGGGGGAQYGGGFDGFDFSDILNQFMGGSGGGRRQSGPPRGRDVEVNLTIDFTEAVFGVEKDFKLSLDDICAHCTGTGAEGKKTKQCATCKGAGQVTRVQQTILGAMQQTSSCPTCKGQGQVPETVCTVCRGEGTVRKEQTLTAKIPAGVDDGATMQMKGQGAATLGGPKGDLYIHIRVRADRRFEREGNTIYSEETVPMAHAALGTETSVETVDGKVTLKVPAGTQSGKVFKLSGRGVPDLNGRGRGDHLVRIEVETPQKLSSKQKALLEQFLAEDGGKKGFFHK